VHKNTRDFFSATAFLMGTCLLQGCNAVRVKEVSAKEPIEHVCIEQNSRVTIVDFVDVMQEAFLKHGISSSVVSPPARCKYTATYTAQRTWNLGTFLSEAHVVIFRDGTPIAAANYHLRGKGGLTLTKFAATRSKILPVMDQMLAQVSRPALSATREYVAPAEPDVAQIPAPPNLELSTKLSWLKDALEAGLITKDEYEAKKQALMKEH